MNDPTPAIIIIALVTILLGIAIININTDLKVAETKIEQLERIINSSN